MPRGRQTLREYIGRLQERLNRVPDDEPWSPIRFPRQEAKKRVKNDKHSKRVVFVVDETAYSEWNEQRERYMQATQENPTFAYLWMLRALQEFPVENVVRDSDAETT